MKSIGGFNFSFNYKSYFESCDFDEQQLNEWWKINEVQQIWMLKENMNDFKVSSRVWKPRIVEKKSSKNLQTFSLLCWKQNRDSKNSKTIDLTHKKTRKEEIRDLLHLWATNINLNILIITFALLKINYKTHLLK